MPNGATLTITDCTNTPGKITGGTGTETRYNTSILSGGYFGGGIYVDGTLNLYGGSIEGNHIPSTDGIRYDGGGGVFVNGEDAYFNMYGGIIQDNEAYGGGAGVLCYKSAFNMYGGEITKHQSPGYNGAVCLDEGSTMTMPGGMIAGNTSYREQIFISKDAKLIVDGSSAVIAEESEQYAVHAFNGGKVEMRNGSIRSEVVILQQSELTMSGGQILKIRVSRGSNLTVSGGKISEGISLGNEDSDYWGWGTIMLSDSPEISSITLINQQNIITVTGQLTYLSPIPVTKSGGVLTSGWSTYMDSAAAANYFNCGEYELQQINGEIHLVEPGAHEHGGIQFDKDLQSLEDQYGYYIIDADSNYYLSNNYTIGDAASFDPTLFIGDGTNEVTVNLCLNGYELTRADSPYVDGSIIVVRENATLNLYDCKFTGTITGGTGRTGEKNGNTYSYGGGILVYGTLNMYGGTITGNSANADGVTEGFGGGVYVADGGAFTMYGGSIINNSAKTTGGGVAVAGDGESVPMSEEFGWNTTITNWTNGANGGGKMAIGNGAGIIVQNNMAGTITSNIYFPDSAPNMTVSSLPVQGTQIGIHMETPEQFAEMGTDVDEAQAQTFFTSDDTTYNVLVIEDGLALGKQQTMPTIGINYQTEMLTDFANDGSYTINGKAVTPSADGTIAIQEEWIGTTISIVRKGDGDKADSNAQNLLIPARPDAPDVTAGIRKINGADTSMEYSSDNGTTWTAFTDETISRISAGTYLVRYCAKEDAFASQSTSEIHVRNSSSGGGGGSPSYYFVTFDTNGGEDMEKLLKVENTKIDLDDYAPEREGYEFVGWYLDEELTESVNEIDLKKNITLYAKWEKAEEEELIEEVEEEAAFSDVSEYDWYYEAVVYTVENGLMNGMGDGTFQPNMPLTREMLAVVLYNVEEQPESAGIITFKDVAAGKWYTDAIAWASQYGIVAGYSETEFGLGDPITREQFAAILYRYANWKGYDTSKKNDLLAYTDVGEISGYAVEAMKWAVASEIIHGVTDTTLVPQGKATRAEAATMLMNFCENVVK